MGRSPCCSKEQGLNKGAWTALEDKTLTHYINLHGEGKWRNIPKLAGLKRCGKSCRLRWLNYLRPDIKRGNITPDEEDLIVRLHKLLGNRWSLIAGRLPGRTDNEIKNYWNTVLSKKAKSPDDQQSNVHCFKKKTVAKQPSVKDDSKASTVLAAPQQQNDTKSRVYFANPASESDSGDGKSPSSMSAGREGHEDLPDFGIDFNQLIGDIDLTQFLYSELDSDLSLAENDTQGNDGDRQLNLDAGFGSLELFLESVDQGWMI